MNSVPNELASSEDFEFQALGEAKNYRAALLREFGPYLRGNVIEVGAGIGQMTAELRALPSIEKLCSIEPDAAFCARMRASLPDHYLIQGTIADLKDQTNWDARLLRAVYVSLCRLDRRSMLQLTAILDTFGATRGLICEANWNEPDSL
jgi:phospholipid N-methyltransferase